MLSVRRVVAGVKASAKSEVLIDGRPAQEVDQPGRGLKFYELWSTDASASREGLWEDAGAKPPTHHPPQGGTKFRLVELMPDRDRRGDPIADLQRLGGRSTAEGSDATFHKNDTVDYNIVIEGEMYALTQEGETLMRKGDVLVQRGTAHTWSNRSGKPCLYASVMVSATALQVGVNDARHVRAEPS